MKKKIIFYAIMLMATGIAEADYLPIGNFWGISDGAIIVKRIDGIVAMEDRDGKRFNLPEIYREVNDFSNGVCTINVRTNESGGNVLGIITNKLIQKAFYLKNVNGKLEIADIDYLQFHCRKI